MSVRLAESTIEDSAVVQIGAIGAASERGAEIDDGGETYVCDAGVQITAPV